MLGCLRILYRTVIQVISDEEENTPQPKQSATEPSNSASPAAATSTEDVIDLTEGLAGLSSRKGKSRARDTSQSRSRSQTLDPSGWEEYRSPITGVRLQTQKLPSVTPPPLSATPSEPTIIIDEEDVHPETRVDVSRRNDEPPHPAPTQSLWPEPPGRAETRLLPQIIKEEMQELVIPPLAEPEKPRRPRKPKETKRFVSTSQKGKLRIKSFVNFHMPFGPEATPKVDAGTLEEALRKLGLEPGSLRA
ncbi:hypothetical protein BDM02DRAFT_3110787 [Thelephora ganbajun]|uniref:Uncharacterized protein n=1 Tax=Thelephora ganbajun TaxID=370292 RepID=A0ACB6ZP96_THEGA|nr:hypothetical protein BDM02DRAFT_3110787 [Thelephora ganbajun]